MMNSYRIATYATMVLALGFWALIIYKGITLPITHDELATIIHYSNFGVWEIMMFPDPWPSNHILHTILSKYSMALFGQEPWAARLPSMLFWGLYALGAFRVGRWLFPIDHWLLFFSVFVLLANPFLLDFFSLARGYAIANALMLNAAVFLMKRWPDNGDRRLVAAWILATLAAYANFTLLVAWAAVNVVIGLTTLYRYWLSRDWSAIARRLGAQLAACGGFALLIYTPINKMQSTNQFVYWDSTGFLENTVVSLVAGTRYGSKMIDIPDIWWAWASVVAVVAAIGLLAREWRKAGWYRTLQTPLLITTLFLLTTVGINLLQAWLLGTPYLTDRTALSYYPMFVLVLLSGLREWRLERQLASRLFAMAVSVLLLLHLGRTLNLNSVREWWYDQHTYAVIDRIDALRVESNPVELQTSWYFQPSFRYHTQVQPRDWIHLSSYREGTPDTLNGARFYYGFQSDVPALKHPYDTVRVYSGGMILMERKGNR